uniref:G-protein coupled receptors family 1 profile domain-containing protein n=1 Tax=Meloidogyne enterolobii TaxID=390850 RepID=A0A6V7UUN4_MELEN|nr:unnamed protein product [Meloidogyne enterolobii]
MNKLNQQNSCSPLQYLFENITEYVLEKLGERCAVSSIIVPTAIIYGLILLIGLFGNICTCLVILKNKSMQNPTNYYLFSLAVSDLLILTLGLPMELYGVFDVLYPYKFGEFVCKGRAFLIEFTSYASILTITCFSVERWLAICFPLRIKLFSTLDRAIRVIIAVWICAFIAALPVLDIVVVNKLPLPDWAIGQKWLLPLISDDNSTLRNTDTCALDFHRPIAQRNFILTAFFLFFLLPALLITLVYCHILQCLCSSVRSSKAIFGGERAQKMRSRKSLLKILVSVVVMFFLCWLPFHIQRLLSIYLNEAGNVNNEEISQEPSSAVFSLFSVVFYISGYCYYSNSACNPILYNILSAKYRRAFCRTILGERMANKLLNEKHPSSVFGPALHSHLNTKLSASSALRHTISPKISSASRLSLPPPPTIISSSKLTTTTNNRPLPQLDRYAWEQFCGNTIMTMAVGSVTSPIKTTNFLTRKRKNGSSTNVEKQKTKNSKNRRRDTTPDLTRRQLVVEDSRPFLEKRNLKT